MPRGSWDLDAYTFRRHDCETVQVLAGIDCYEYQSCEHEGWETSEARAFCSALRRAMIGRLPGYRDSDWEITRETGSRAQLRKRYA